MAKESFDKKGFIDTKDNPYLKRWCTAMFINRREGKLTDEQKTLLDELDFFVRKRICNGRPVYCKKIEEVVSNIEAYYKEHGHTKGLDSPTRHFIANHKKEILNTKDLHQRLVNVKYPSFHDEDEEKFIALKELVSYGKKPKTGSSLYNFAQRNVHSHTKYTSKIKKMNLFTDQNSVIERNKEMVSNWLAENRRFPKVGKNKKIKNEEYYTYVNLTTWLKCKTEELKQFALNELAKYGISYTSSGKTKEEYVNDFKRDLEEFIETNGRIPTKKDGSIGKKLDNYRRRALRNNDTEMIKYLEGLGITVDVSTRYEEIFERNLARIIAILRAEKTITCAHPIYSLIKQYNNEYVSGRMEKSRIERFRETGFILSDNTFCTFTNGRIYNH